MKAVCMYFELHQPYRLKWFWPDHSEGFERYFDTAINREIFEKVADKCYLPATKTMLQLIEQYEGDFRFSISVTGTLLSQCKKWNPKVIELFQALADTGCVEFLDETNYHSLAGLFDDKSEFIEQVREHHKLISETLGAKPLFFRNTELLYNNSIAKTVSEMGYSGILIEGVDGLVDTPNYVYNSKNCDLKVLLRNYKMSDDIGYRFSARWWSEYPLTASKWADWATHQEGEILNIFMDYETFGEHQWTETGIFDFLRELPGEVLERNLTFQTPSEIIGKYDPVGEIDVKDLSTISWADIERDTSAWLGNDMQRRCFEEVKLLEPYVKKTGDKELIKIWKHLLTSDHYYYICTKWLGDGDVHSYFSIHTSPYEAAINFMAIINDFKSQVFKNLAAKDKNIYT
ncbi:glycoside hydrolase family 57 protein [Methanohalophilus halophilus]|uniref:Alpha-amylase n=1 Tax=Methanohalophilus halophilus TaxID=2177 RepID=A0A1L3Q4D1_9EURY|nr:glycoside hydrolase family 57 protein [Methanohalophilus halophilus]APH39730.1 alpha-amylase [Methanohalophilus halophilus]RNI08930.1 alpha-amylase [Methanohalophilus halophilus]SDW37946.1 alpha-amylase [Methanohalophilus halophilus]